MTAASRSSDSEAAAGDLLAAALAYALAGLPVLPLDGKVPRNTGGLLNASTDPAVVAEWWHRWPDANVGIRTGAASGLVVLDVDVPAGLRSLAELERRHGKLTSSKALTGSGGWHFYFAHPDAPLGNSAGRLGEGLDVRGDGGYVVAPPSVHASGRVYRWARGLERVTEAPAWLLEAATRQHTAAPSIGEQIPKGERDSTLASLAGSMRRRGMGEAEIAAALQVANRDRCTPPLPERDVERIAASVSRYQPETQEPVQAEPFELPMLTARALCALPEPEAGDELLGQLLVRGHRLVIGAHTGEGKTTWTLQAVRAILLGEDFLGFPGQGGGRALVLDAEQGLRSIKRRLREAGLDESELVDYVRVPDGLSLDSDPRHVAAVEAAFAIGNYSLVVADPLYKLHAGDSNAEREAVDLMRRFDGWREEFGFALVLPVHCRKPVPGTKFSIHDLFGSSAYVRGAEVVVGLQRVSDGYSRLHFLKDREGDLEIGARWGLLFDRELGYRRDPDDGTKPTAKDAVRELLAQDPTLTVKQLETATGFAERTLRQAVKRVRDESERRLFEGAGE